MMLQWQKEIIGALEELEEKVKELEKRAEHHAWEIRENPIDGYRAAIQDVLVLIDRQIEEVKEDIS